MAVDSPIMAPQATLEQPSQQVTPKLSTNRRLLLQSLANGKSMAEAATDAKMLRTSAYRAVDDLRERLPELMDGVGLDVRSILCRIREKMDATETKFIPRPEGIAERVVEAHGVQLKAIELAANLRPELRERQVAIGTVNVMFAGALPDWLQGQPQDQACRAVAVGASPDLVQTGNSADLVHTINSGDNAPPPLSAIEGTGREGGGLSHTHSANLASLKCDDTVPVAAVPAKAGTKLSQRIVKKRQARLPVFRGAK